MGTELGSNTLLRVVSAVVKHHVKKVLGDEATGIVAESVLGKTEEQAAGRVAQFFSGERQADELARAVWDADRCFRDRCSDGSLRQLAEMPIGELPSFQAAISALPETVDRVTLSEAIQGVLKGDYGGQLTGSQISKASGLYLECLEKQLLRVGGIREIVTGLATLNTERTVTRTEGKVDLLRDGLSDLNANVALSNEFQLGGALRATNELVILAEAMNPGLDFTIASLGKSTHITISAKPDAGGVDFGTLHFSGDQQLSSGFPKLKQALDEGRPVTLEPGEYEWQSHVQLPMHLEMKGGENYYLSITPDVPPQEIPVRLEAHRPDGSVLGIDYATSKCLRRGQKEFELQIGGGQFAGHFNVVLRKAGSSQVEITVNLDSLSPDRVLRTIEFVESLQHGAEWVVSPLNEESPFELRGWCNGNFPDFSAAKTRLGWLDTINKAYGVRLKHLANIDDETWERIWLFAEVTRDRVVRYHNNGSATLEVAKAMGTKLLEAFHRNSELPENIAVSLDSPQVELLGELIPLSAYLTIYNKPALNEDMNELRDRLEQLDEESVTPVQIRYGALYISIKPQKFVSFN